MSRKTAVVTGASSGIGRAVARALVAGGYNVVANSRRVSTSGFVTGEVLHVDGGAHAGKW